MRIAALLFASVVALMPLCARADDPLDLTLSVSGHASLSKTPDIAHVGGSIVTSADLADGAVASNNAAFEAIKIKLHALGLTENTITTTSFSMAFVPKPKARPLPASPQVVIMPEPARTGFIVTRAYAVTVPSLDRAGKVIDACIGGGTTNVAVSYRLKDARSAYYEAVAQAMQDAAGLAQAAAKGGNMHLVRVRTVSVDQVQTESAGRQVDAAFAKALSAPRAPTQITPGDIDVSASVSVTYIIAP